MVVRREISLNDWLEYSLGGKNIFCNMLTGFIPMSDEHRLSLAIENLKNYFFFCGISENMSASLLLLCKILGWRFPFYIMSNVTKRNKENFNPSESAVNKFTCENNIDFLLYEHIKNNFELLIKTEGNGFLDALNVVRKIQIKLNSISTQYLHQSAANGFASNLIEDLLAKIQQHDLSKIYLFLESSSNDRALILKDLYDGYVDGVSEDNSVYGWAVNINKQNLPVSLKVVSNGNIIAEGSTGKFGPDVVAAGYSNKFSRFSIKLPMHSINEFEVLISGSNQKLEFNKYKYGWYSV